MNDTQKKWLLIVFGLLLAVGSVALLEGALALLNVGDDWLHDDPFVGFAPGSSLFEAKTSSSGKEIWATRPQKLAFFNHQEFPREKRSGTLRVFALGGSTTAGRPYDDRTAFSQWLQLFLAEADPSQSYEVINAGAISYASYRVALLMKELVRYEPDLFVIYTGHNEFLEERSYSEIIHQPEVVKRLRMWLGGFRVAALARRGLRAATGGEEAVKVALEAEVNTRLDSWTGLDLYHRDEELEQSIEEHFSFNLERMVALARGAGADLIFVEPVANLKDFSPFKSEHQTPWTGELEIAFERELDQAAQRLSGGDIAAALGHLDAAQALDPLFAEVHFRRGHTLLALGDEEAAREAFLAAKELDVAPLRVRQAFIDSLRTLASRRDLPLIPLPEVLAREGERRFGVSIPGREFLLDHVHPDMETHRRIAELVVEAMAEQGLVNLGSRWTEENRTAVFDRVVAAIDPRYSAQRDLNLGKVLGWSGKLAEAEQPLRSAVKVLADEPDAHLNLGILLQKTGRWEEAATELQKAATLDPGSATAHFNLGVTFARLGRWQGAIDALEKALDLRPDFGEAAYNLGSVYRHQGDLVAAQAAFDAALKADPSASTPYLGLGRLFQQQGHLKKAEGAFRAALERLGGSAEARTELAGVLVAQGQMEAAQEELQGVLFDHPDFAEAHYHLGLLWSGQGRQQEAWNSYQEALRLDPDHPRAHNNLAILQAGRGEYQEASLHLLRSIELDPTYAEAYFNLGVVYDNAGAPREAVRAIRRALELAPEEPRFHLGLGMLLFGLGELEQAAPHLGRARAAGLALPPQVAAALAP
ncbi:MAG: tetratricopeptide repeat protein [Deltaproteobacteria bacterium]|nr:tetratricopeptide repeat protein [Deltaproteobacteria bacterium]